MIRIYDKDKDVLGDGEPVTEQKTSTETRQSVDNG